MSNLTGLKEQFEESLTQLVLARTPEKSLGLREMFRYHFGWNDLTSKTGKRLRPMLLLTSNHMFGGQLLI